ncbi:GNAT family N-acetyltransferase [Roseovarius sp. A21]|uniref:GNAT family N-acetyltransferase n=1 Tax=Roseovarius bejariae TaxID=2576383 RepID=A0A844CZ31_9RHOB|nr:GNAT family N-acetyltransferase [Roseovarius bejariae]MRU15880.1 GNAT family N-acetyltransferase [Roseovarius bejariae]
MLIVEAANPRDPGPRAVLEASHALMRALFPPEDNYFLDLDALCGDSIRFFAARQGEKTLGTGALAIMEGYGEVKSMFTTPEARGKGVAAALLRAIEDEARALSLPALRLETAEALDSAMRLYARHGFTRRGIFGDYRPNQTSVFMEKPLV